MRKKIITTLFGAILLLVATGLTEYLFYRQDETTWVERFQKRLHRQEVIADEVLASLRDSVDIDARQWDEDLVIVGVREGKLFFWTSELIGGDGFIRQLGNGGNFVKIVNTYYEVRGKKHKNIDYYA